MDSLNPDREMLENFDPDLASPAEWARMYRACRLQVVPCYMPGELKDGSWKRPKLPEWKTLAGVPNRRRRVRASVWSRAANLPSARKWGS